MNILKVSCKQFAAFQDFSAEFKPGVNIIFGQNESGKSSLVNLLIESLFRDSKLNRNTTSDKDFIEAFFPCRTKGNNTAGNFVDGEIKFESNSGEFTLNKTWGQGYDIILTTPSNNKITGDAEIKDLLLKEFGHDENIFREILLSPQVNNLETLNKLIRDKKALSSSGEIINTLTQLYAEAGNNIAIESIEQGINDKIEDLGKNWDKLNDRPKRQDRRDIISDIYKIREAKSRELNKIKEYLNSINLLEQDFNYAKDRFNKANSSAAGYKERYEYFLNIEIRLSKFLADSRVLSNKLSILKDKHAACAKALDDWPNLNKNFELANSLRDELNKLNFNETMSQSKELKDLMNNLEQELENLRPADEIKQDIKSAQGAFNKIMECISKLKGFNIKLEAALHDSNYKLEITQPSLNNAVIKPDNISANKSEYKINRTAMIKIPGVASMRISPADVNVEETQAEWEANKKIIYAIIAKYNLENINGNIEILRDKLNAMILAGERKRLELENYKREHQKLLRESKDMMINLNGKFSMDDENTQDRTRDEIIKDINALCGRADKLDKYIGRAEAQIKNYENFYRSPDDLQELFNALKLEINKVESDMAAVKDQVKDMKPECFSIDITGLRMNNEQAYKDYEQEKIARQQEMAELKGKLELAKSNAASLAAKVPDLENALQTAQRELENKKLELERWENILKIFNKTKEQVEKNPVDYLIEKFSSYLHKISSGRLEADNLDKKSKALDIKPEIYSNNKILRWLNISEGTKETIALAFRLAVINQLYQDGGAVAVFDDPLVNMDAERRAKACEIIKDFAANNQVIFLTCHDEYKEIFAGCNFIELK
ncbi:MAG: hypothetical protein IJT22_00365 [Synergistaceae bacterium]|nr:hypothetical protein [Synergistaceae bacterium]